MGEAELEEPELEVASPASCGPVACGSGSQPARCPDGRPLRVAHVQLLPLLSGVQRVTLDILTSLDASRFAPHLICREPGPLSDAALRAGIPCDFVPELTRAISPGRDWRAYRRLQAIFAQRAFDVVHTNSSKPGILGRLAARQARVPAIVHTVHGFAFPAARAPWTRAIYRTAERHCRPATDALICLNESDRAVAIEQLQFSPDQVHLVANGIDLDKFRPLDAARRTHVRQQLSCPPERLAVIMVGRLWPQKHPLCFVEMAERLIRRGVPANFYLVGDGELRADLETAIRRVGMTEQIQLLGWRDDVANLLPAMDLFVLTSRWEGLPLAILEAQACGLPVVASDIPGNRDALAPDETGLLAELDNPDSFAAQVELLLNNASRLAQFGAAARRRIEQQFSLRATVRQVERLYLDLLAR